MNIFDKPKPIKRSKSPGRNDKCPCGSGKKAKNCCLTKVKLFNSMSSDEKKRFYTESLFMSNRIKEQIAKHQQPVEVSTIAPIYKGEI